MRYGLADPRVTFHTSRFTAAGSSFFSILLGMAMWLATGVALAAETPSESPALTTTENGSNPSDLSGLIDDIRKRTEGQTGAKWKETADAVLIQGRETKWPRYLKAAMNLPDFVDLGIENRTRFESYDHPWRSTQKIGNGQLYKRGNISRTQCLP